MTRTTFQARALGAVAAGFLVLAVSFAARSSIGPGMTPWFQDLGWAKGQVSAIGALALCIMDYWQFALGYGLFGGLGFGLVYCMVTYINDNLTIGF